MRSLPKAEWQRFFDGVSKALLGKRAEVEVASLDLGDQIVAEWIPLLGITYEPRDDLLDIVLDSANTLIRHPRDIAVEEGSAGLASVAVTSADGAYTIRLRDPLMLPPPSRT